jgi:hypothetical protein
MNLLRTSARSGQLIRRSVQKRFSSSSGNNEGGKTTYRVVEPNSHGPHYGGSGGSGFHAHSAYTTNGQRVVFNQQTYSGRRSFGYSVAGLFSLGCNIIYACCRAQDKTETHTLRMFTFLFGLPGTIVSFFLVREGSEIVYGIDLPKKSTIFQQQQAVLSERRLEELEQRLVMQNKQKQSPHRPVNPNDRAVN